MVTIINYKAPFESKRPRRKHVAKIALTATVAIGITCLTMGASSAEQPADADAGSSNGALREATNAAANQIRSLNANNDQFFAASPDVASGVINVYLVGAGREDALDLNDLELSDENRIVYHTAVMSLDLEAKLFAALSESRDSLAELGVEVVGIRSGEIGEAVVVEFDAKAKPLTADLLEQVGRADWPVELYDSRYVQFIPGGLIPFESRVLDQSPLSGGARLHGPQVSSTNSFYAKCSTGFSGKSRTTGLYM